MYMYICGNLFASTYETAMCHWLNIQISPEELVSDAEQLFTIVMCDAEFDGVMKDLEHHQATNAVYDAVKMLQTAPEPDVETDRMEFMDLSPEVHCG